MFGPGYCPGYPCCPDTFSAIPPELLAPPGCLSWISKQMQFIELHSGMLQLQAQLQSPHFRKEEIILLIYNKGPFIKYMSSFNDVWHPLCDTVIDVITLPLKYDMTLGSICIILVKAWSNKDESGWESQLSLLFDRQLSSTLMHSRQLWAGSNFDESQWEVWLVWPVMRAARES